MNTHTFTQSLSNLQEKNKVMSFNFMNQSVRIVDKDGVLWFVAKDVADILGYTNTRQAIIQHCKGSLEIRLPSERGEQSTKIIPEPDVYRLIMKSKKPEAEKFEEWVVSDVLPSIRKTGQYGIKTLSTLELLEMGAKSERERLQLENENKTLKCEKRILELEKINLHHEYQHMKDMFCNMKDVKSEELGLIFKIGACKMNGIMEKHGYLKRIGGKRIPKMKYLKEGFFKFELVSCYRSKKIFRQMQYTGKGAYLAYETLKNEGLLPQDFTLADIRTLMN